jgi:hypothetical protein
MDRESQSQGVNQQSVIRGCSCLVLNLMRSRRRHGKLWKERLACHGAIENEGCFRQAAFCRANWRSTPEYRVSSFLNPLPMRARVMSCSRRSVSCGGGRDHLYALQAVGRKCAKLSARRGVVNEVRDSTFGTEHVGCMPGFCRVPVRETARELAAKTLVGLQRRSFSLPAGWLTTTAMSAPRRPQSSNFVVTAVTGA